MDVDKLEAGVETDRLIHETLGECVHIISRLEDDHAWCGKCGDTLFLGTALTVPHYSIYWDAAMAASEKGGLFGCSGIHLDKGLGGAWEVRHWVGGSEVRTHAPTGPLAICKAILKLDQEARNGTEETQT